MKKRNPFASNIFSSEKDRTPGMDDPNVGGMTFDELLADPMDGPRSPLGDYTLPDDDSATLQPGAAGGEATEAAGEVQACPVCAARKDADDAHLRAMAELENARKRLAREREEQIRFASESVLSDLIPSLDNLDLALQHAGNGEGGKDFVTGVRMTRNMMVESLKKHGLKEVGMVGEEFNPAVHEAVGMAPDGNVPDGHVCTLLSHGYTLNDRLLRPARVMVCKNQ